jgi:hypothetical protein
MGRYVAAGVGATLARAQDNCSRCREGVGSAEANRETSEVRVQILTTTYDD